MNSTKQKIGLFLGPLLFLVIFFLLKLEGLGYEGRAVLASAAWVAIWWITEALPLAVTSLLPIVLFPLSGGFPLKETTANYGHKYIFLFIGGFALSIAMQKWNLHKRIALTIIRLVGTNVKSIILGFMVATAFLSMWISNTATTAMILPVGIAIFLQLKDNPATVENENIIFGKALMLSIAFSASIGGMATLIGTPPNLILAGVIEESYNIELSFSQWFIFGFPISVVLLGIAWFYITNIAFSFKQTEFPGGKAEIKRQLSELGEISYEEKAVFFVFILTAVAWITRSFLLKNWIPAIDDTIIAVIGALLLFLIPDKNNFEKLLNWKDAVKLPWGILLLFGGGMALAKGFEASGLALWIGSQLEVLQGFHLVIMLLILITAVNFLTEITSNMATTAMLLPVLVSLSAILDINPYYLMVGATVAASCAFMLPVATPPNAIVFGSGILSIEDMIKKGFFMNLISIIILTLFVYYVLPYLWDFQ